VRISISRTVAFPTAPVQVDFYGLHPGHFASAGLLDGATVSTHADHRGRATLRLTVTDVRLERSALALRGGYLRRNEPFYVLPPATVVPVLPQPLRPVPLLATAGDVACHPGTERTPEACHHDATGEQLARAQPDAVAMLGDAQYDDGATDEFAAYDATWGRLKDRTRPALGNHEYRTPGAAGYFGYFGPVAGTPDRGYYSYDLGTWHVVVLNSNCGFVSCAAGGAQERWLRADLAAHPRPCTLAYWHHPRHSSAQQSRENTSVQALWQALSDGGADLALSAHVHSYERIAPLTADGAVDHAHGMRSFVVGTGGRSTQQFLALKPYSEKSSSSPCVPAATTGSSSPSPAATSPTAAPGPATRRATERPGRGGGRRRSGAGRRRSARRTRRASARSPGGWRPACAAKKGPALRPAAVLRR